MQRIVEVSKPKEVILFGSYVSAKMHMNSDLDILFVTGDDVERPRRKRLFLRLLMGINKDKNVIIKPGLRKE
jgi:predicted nucleotidyltransferase